MHQQTITCLNGHFLPSGEAMLPIADRGFRFGDGVFETIRLVDGVPYQWEIHLSRLNTGLAALRITPPVVDWKAMAREVIAKNSARAGYLRLAVSRGVGSRGYMPDAGITANWAIEYLPAVPPSLAPCMLWQTTITRSSPTSMPSNHKLAHGIGSTLALLDAHDNACDEALMLSVSGTISEASSGNLFWFSAGQLFTPSLATGCLAGTTRAAIMRLADVCEIDADIAALLNADAIFISNVRVGVWPVATILPYAKQYDAAHAQMRTIAHQLENDRAAYVAAQAKAWA